MPSPLATRLKAAQFFLASYKGDVQFGISGVSSGGMPPDCILFGINEEGDSSSATQEAMM
jgi:hypothetical protein